ncbi:MULTISPECIES: hypothetical protein [unclassified Streptomyces]|uniref:hypothetical protein n=1 Tax=unclassified Streptomyces TaxID=2593676 RepID=UPI00381EC654
MYATQALPHLVPLAEELDKNKVTPGVLGFIVFAALAVGVWALMKSMNRHMGKVDFEEAPEVPGTQGTPKASAAAGSAGSVKRK